MNELAKLIEAALFSAAHPLTVSDFKALEPGLDAGRVREVLDGLARRYEEHGNAFELVELGDGFQLLTRSEYAEAITRARIVSRPRKLSAAAMETLAIIAYRQPVGRAEIEEIRGVAADGVLRSLQDRGLIDVPGRGEGLGRPLLYGTTRLFLEMLGLSELDELPRLDQLSVALRPLGPGLPRVALPEAPEAPEEPAAAEPPLAGRDGPPPAGDEASPDQG